MNSRRPVVHIIALDDARIQTEHCEIDPSAQVVFACGIYLALESNTRLSRRALQQLLWPDAPDQTAGHRLRQTLLKLRQAGFPVISESRYLITTDCEFTFDFSWLDKSQTPDRFVGASVLPGFDGSFSWAYSEWIESKRSSIRASLNRRLLQRIAGFRSSGDWTSVEESAHQLLRHSPENEEATIALAESLAMRGEKVQAVRLLDEYLTGDAGLHSDIKVSAVLMRRRISDRMPQRVPDLNGDAPLIGRGEDLERLVSLYAAASNRKATFCAISGDAGIGKSRLLTEFLRFASLQGAISHRISCRSSDAARQLAVLLELIPLLRGMRGAIGSAPETLEFFDALITHRPSKHSRESKRSSDYAPGALDSAILDIVDAVTDESPLIVAIEDCQFIDPASAVVLSRLVDALTEQRLLMLFTIRSGEEQPFNLSSAFKSMRLHALNDDSSRRILRSIIEQRGRNVGDQYLDWCTEVAEGNPFFLHELANHWLETGQEHATPPSLTTVLQQRLSRLQPNSLQLLQACALLENHASLDNVEAVLGYPAHQLLHSINELAISGMVIVNNGETSGTHGGRLNSRHELLSSTALSLLAAPALIYLHRRAAKVLQSRIDESGDASTLWSCAKHWQLAGDASQAFRLALSCANHLFEVGLNQDAADAFAKASRYCVSDEDLLMVLEGQATAAYRSSDWRRVTATIGQARDLRQRLTPDASNHDELELMQLRADWVTLNSDQILSRSLECLTAESAKPGHRLEAGVMALMMVSFTDDRQQAARVLRLICEIGAGSEHASSVLQAKMIYHTNWGSFVNAIDAASALVTLHKSGTDVSALFRSLCNASVTLRAGGKFDDARQNLLEALEIADRHHLQLSKSRAIPMLAHLALEQGQTEDAKHWLQALEGIAIPTEDRLGQTELISIRARVALLEGRFEDARVLVEGDLIQMRLDNNPHRRVYAVALAVVVELAIHRKASEEVVAQLRDAHLQSRGNLFQAFAAYALYAGLVSRGLIEEADMILREYLERFRRERHPPPQHLLPSILALINPRDELKPGAKLPSHAVS